MIKRFIAFRWMVAAVMGLTLLLVSLQKSDDLASSRFLPAFLSNAYFNHVNQSIQQSSADDRIVFVNARLGDETDSLLAALIQKIASYNPAVIALDYTLTDSLLVGKFSIPDGTIVVLGTPVDDKDSIYYSINPFTVPVHFAHIMSDAEFIPEPLNSLEPLAIKVAQFYSPPLIDDYYARNNKFELVRYSSTETIYEVRAQEIVDDLLVEEYLTDKIVLVGYGGDTETIPGHSVPTRVDNVDVHQTPIGRQFGAVILINQIKTLLGNLIERSSVVFDYLIMIVIALASCCLVLGFSHLSKKILYILTKVYVALMWLLLSIGGVWLFHSSETFVDYQSYCLTTIISTELSFWLTLKQ
jgi:CHASE2 domain-containing sensor protein